MKKLLVAILAAYILFMSVGVAMADSIDLSGYTDEEIVELLNQVQAEVINRHIEKTATLQKGTYVAGKDIPVGSYVYAVTVLDIERFDDGFQYGTLSVRTPEDPEDESPSKLYEYVENTIAASYYITLDQGDKLVSPVAFTLTTGGVIFK